MVISRMIVSALKAALSAIVLCGVLCGGSGYVTPSRKPYPRQELISQALPAATGSIACQVLPPGASNDYLTCAYTGTAGTTMVFFLFVPANYDANQRYPLLLVLHGGGERAQPSQTAAQNRAAVLGQEYVAVLGPGSPTGTTIQTRYPSFVVVPQETTPSVWVNTDLNKGSYALPADPPADIATAMIIVGLVQQIYTGIDPNRRYIAGISVGAFGVWDAVERWPGYFAAAVPAAGAGSPALASEIVDLPIWDFHGAADVTVPLSASQDMVLAIRAAGGQPCYTVYPGAPHGIWSQVFGLANNPNNPLYSWLFAQRKGGPATSSAC